MDEWTKNLHKLVVILASVTIRYDTRCYFKVRSKAGMSQLSLSHALSNLANLSISINITDKLDSGNNYNDI